MSKLIVKALHPLKVPIDSVHPDPQNVRKHPESNKAAIKKSLQGFQQRKPIVVNKNTNIIEAGNGLWEQMKAIGAKEIAVVFVDDTDEQAKAYGIMDNRSAELAEWDLPGLKDILESLDTGAFDMDLTGFDTESIESLMTQLHEPELDEKYTQKIIPPVYTPKGEKPKISELYDDKKTQSLISDIDKAKLPKDITAFLKVAAQRHTAFHFRNIAEYYCHATPEIQDLMERSGLIIIDFNKAIEYGFVHLVEGLQALADQEADNEG